MLGPHATMIEVLEAVGRLRAAGASRRVRDRWRIGPFARAESTLHVVSHRHSRVPPLRPGDAPLVFFVSWWFTSAAGRKKTTKTPRTPRHRANPPGLLPMARPPEPAGRLRVPCASRRQRCPRRRIGRLTRAEPARHFVSHRHGRAPPARLGDAPLVFFVSWWFTSATERKKTTKAPRTPRHRANPPGLSPMARPPEPAGRLRVPCASLHPRSGRRIGPLTRADSAPRASCRRCGVDGPAIANREGIPRIRSPRQHDPTTARRSVRESGQAPVRACSVSRRRPQNAIGLGLSVASSRSRHENVQRAFGSGAYPRRRQNSSSG